MHGVLFALDFKAIVPAVPRLLSSVYGVRTFMVYIQTKLQMDSTKLRCRCRKVVAPHTLSPFESCGQFKVWRLEREKKIVPMRSLQITATGNMEYRFSLQITVTGNMEYQFNQCFTEILTRVSRNHCQYVQKRTIFCYLFSPHLWAKRKPPGSNSRPH